MSVHRDPTVFPYARRDSNWKPEGYHHKVYENILHTIGDTPLVRLNRIPKDHGLECEIYAKCEFMNPGGSIKDRVAYHMLVEAERCGRARPGTHFVEPTSGNTGIGMALATAVHGHPCTIVTPDKNSDEKVNTNKKAASAQGYACTIVTPDKNSDEKVNTIRLLGAAVVQTPATAPCEDARHYMAVTRRIREDDPDAISTDQYSNNVNPVTHYEYTAQEILSALGRVDMVVMGSGTGGTLSGVAHKVKERYPKCLIVAVDPEGSGVFGTGEITPFMVEGIGGDFVPDVLDKSVVDRVEAPNDCDSFNMAREIIRKEGLLCGGSSGAAMISAIRAVKALGIGAGQRVVVVLADGIRNYMTKFVSDQWMEAYRFKEPPAHDNLKWWSDPLSSLTIDRSVPLVCEEQSCADAVHAMGSDHCVAVVVDKDGFYRGAISKDSLRKEATNPKSEDNLKLNLNEPLSLHLIKNCYKIAENEGSPTVGLVSRVLDIAPFVVIVEKRQPASNVNAKDTFVPRGIVTTDSVFNYILNNQHGTH